MNLYGNLQAIKHAMRVTDVNATRDAQLLFIGEAISRAIDRRTHRHFYVWSGTKLMDGPPRGSLLIEDLLSLTEMKADTDGDGAFDDETWVEDTDFHLQPYNAFPKTRLELARSGSFGFSCARRVYRIGGDWGYGDGHRSAPWDETGLTVTFAAADPGDPPVTTATASGSGLQPGDTILVADEQIYIGAVNGAALSECVRGVNGTAAVGDGYTDATVYRAAYPRDLVLLAAAMTAREWQVAGAGAFQEESIGDYRYKVWDQAQQESAVQRVLSRFERVRGF